MLFALDAIPFYIPSKGSELSAFLSTFKKNSSHSNGCDKNYILGRYFIVNYFIFIVHISNILTDRTFALIKFLVFS